MMKMHCGCYYNGYGFTVGTKWLTVTKIETNKKEKVLLTRHILERLEEIKAGTEPTDAQRTYDVLRLFDYVKKYGGNLMILTDNN